MAPVLAYWDIRGRAEVCRLLLRYCGVEFKDKRYATPSYWFSTKFNLGLDFPNLPYYIDGDFKLTQSAAILEYIADSHDMIPTCKKSRAVLHMINDDINDFRNSFGQIVYDPDFKNLLVKFKENLPQQFKKYEQYLGDKEWLTGEKINYPDFNLCEFLNVLVKLDPACLDGHAKLKAYLHRFENLPALKGYISSKEFKTSACNAQSAQWVGDK
ncbi:hypothetical protein Aperf_G00000053357 [Anoplocephala perfoliata]